FPCTTLFRSFVESIEHSAVSGVFIGATHAKLITVQSPDNDRIFINQSLDSSSGVLGLVAFKNSRRGVELVAGVVQDILDTDDHAGKLSSLTFGDLLVDKVGLRQSGLLINFNEGVEMRLRCDVL